VGSGPYSPYAPRPLLTGPLCPITIYGSPVALPKFQMAPTLTFVIFCGSRQKQPRYACLSAKKYGPRFHPLLHTSYTLDCLTAPLIGDVFSSQYPFLLYLFSMATTSNLFIFEDSVSLMKLTSICSCNVSVLTLLTPWSRVLLEKLTSLCS
jgi:hypothetical protein